MRLFQVTLITEDIFSNSFRPSFWNGPKKGCRYGTIQRKTVDDKTIRIDIIQPYKGGSFTAKQMDDIKKNYWVLSTFKDGGSTWVKILSGKWKPWAELELARELAQPSSIEDCKRGYAPIVRAVSNYRSENTEKRPSPLFNRVGPREI
ncbi:hypothetical protein FRC03_006050 [Tulasnella sp. 419]|nr:hypothetical protein FRC03_006050 [Tulasnella sp. 419]